MLKKLFPVVAIFISLTIFLATAELILITYDYTIDGSLISPINKIQAEAVAMQLPGNPAMRDYGVDCHWTDMFQSHPYLFYAKKRTGDCAEQSINRQGFRGPEYPLQKLSKTFTIMVTGGSVAEDQMGFESVTTLEQTLNTHYKMDGFENFKVIVGAVAAARLPNQLILLALYSPVIHGFISLDGFNEFELIQQPVNRMAGFPADPFIMQGINDTIDVKKFMFAKCDGLLLRHQLQSPVLLHLRSYFYLTQLLRQVCRQTARSLSTDGSIYMEYFKFPADFNDQSKQMAYNELQFLNYNRNMSAIAKANHIKEIYFIQPTPAFKKNLSQFELANTGDLSYRALYKKMEQDRLALVSENIPVVSLIDMFQDEREQIYNDKIHLNSVGKKALESKILDSLEKHWHIQKR